MASSDPHILLTGALSDGRRILVTVYPDGGEVAFRDYDAATWGAPTYLHRLEVPDGNQGKT